MSAIRYVYVVPNGSGSRIHIYRGQHMVEGGKTDCGLFVRAGWTILYPHKYRRVAEQLCAKCKRTK